MEIPLRCAKLLLLHETWDAGLLTVFLVSPAELWIYETLKLSAVVVTAVVPASKNGGGWSLWVFSPWASGSCQEK